MLSFEIWRVLNLLSFDENVEKISLAFVLRNHGGALIRSSLKAVCTMQAELLLGAASLLVRLSSLHLCLSNVKSNISV